MQSLVLRKKEDFSVGLFVPQTEFIPCALSGQRALYVRLKRNFEEVPGRQKERANWILHPLLIYTMALKDIAQNVLGSSREVRV
jgi:hypothetical protein